MRYANELGQSPVYLSFIFQMETSHLRQALVIIASDLGK